MIDKMWATIRRDAFFDISYPLPFAVQWVAIVVGVTAFHFVSQLVPPSRALGTGGHKSTYFIYVVINLAFMVLQTNALQAFSKQLRRDQMLGLIEPMFATATPVALLIFSSGLWKLFLSVLQTVLYLTVATVFFNLSLGRTNVVTLFVFMALSLACMAAIGIIGAGVVIYSKQEPPSNFLVGGAASMLAGVLFPISLLPTPLRVVSWLLPITHALAGVRAAVAGQTLAQVWGEAVWLLIAAVILVPTALFVFARFVDRAREDGTLAHS